MTSVKWTDSVAPLREPNFRWFFASRFVNTFGGVMANIALAFAVLEITDSASALGVVLAAHTIPVVIFLLGGGVIADRFPRAVVLQVSNVVSGTLQGAIALLVITGTAEIWMLVVLTAIQGVSSAVAFPAMASIMPLAGPARAAPAGQRTQLPAAGQPERPRPDRRCPPGRHGRGRLGADGRRASPGSSRRCS